MQLLCHLSAGWANTIVVLRTGTQNCPDSKWAVGSIPAPSRRCDPPMGGTTSEALDQRSPAGWYADPWNAERPRWWDGTTWTAHGRPIVQAGHSPATFAEALLDLARRINWGPGSPGRPWWRMRRYGLSATAVSGLVALSGLYLFATADLAPSQLAAVDLDATASPVPRDAGKTRIQSRSAPRQIALTPVERWDGYRPGDELNAESEATESVTATTATTATRATTEPARSAVIVQTTVAPVVTVPVVQATPTTVAADQVSSPTDTAPATTAQPSPTTNAPATTAEPTTATSTAVGPVTSLPTTLAPTTLPSSTAPPTTQTATTAAPTTAAQTSTSTAASTPSADGDGQTP